MKLRPPQARILDYDSGKMAISAVPGSGKTFILSLLAAQLLAEGHINIAKDQQILIVTYLNSSVETFRSRVRNRLDELNLPLIGYEVRTLHSLSLEIVRSARGEFGPMNEEPLVIDESQADAFLTAAIDSWIGVNFDHWQSFLSDDDPTQRVRWREVTQSTAKSFIQIAKNNRLNSEQIHDRINKNQEIGDAFTKELFEEINLEVPVFNDRLQLLSMLNGIYGRYYEILKVNGVLDFDDLIWSAVDTLQYRADIASVFRNRWPYVLEDEAQDSVPLQELLLTELTGIDGNWVRAGDPNQAITSTFTAAHPKYFNKFLSRSDVSLRPLPHSGRSARKILGAANTLVLWTSKSHPVPEVRQSAFLVQEILPTPPGDNQPNPPDYESMIRIRVFKHREDEELPTIARLAHEYTQDYPKHTIAILVPTNEVGHRLAEHLDNLKSDYDDLLRGGRRIRELAGVLQSLLALLANPLDKGALIESYTALNNFGHPLTLHEVENHKILPLLRSIYLPELFLFPSSSYGIDRSFPKGILSPEEEGVLERLSDFLKRCLSVRSLPVEDLVLTLSDLLFQPNYFQDDKNVQSDQAVAYHIAQLVGQWRELHPEWRLPELSARLREVAKGRIPLRLTGTMTEGYTPSPGRITLSTQHGAKGMEWDGVFLVGIDGRWIPGTLEAPFYSSNLYQGIDLSAETKYFLQELMDWNNDSAPGHTPTEAAQIEVICERLRLLYVGITRARRYLYVSRSRKTRPYQTEYESEPATALGVLYRFIRDYENQDAIEPDR